MSIKVTELKQSVDTAFQHISRANSEITINTPTESIDELKAIKHAHMEDQRQLAYKALDHYIDDFRTEYQNTQCTGMLEPIEDDLLKHDQKLIEIIKMPISEMMSTRTDMRSYQGNLVPPLTNTNHNEAVGSVLHVLIKNRFAEYCYRVKAKVIVPYTRTIEESLTTLKLPVRAAIDSRDMQPQIRERFDAVIHDLYENTVSKVQHLDFCVIPGWEPAKGEHEIAEAVAKNFKGHQLRLQTYVWKYVAELKTVCEENVKNRHFNLNIQCIANVGIW